MPANSAHYQNEYRKKNAHKRKVVSVALPSDDHAEILRYAGFVPTKEREVPQEF